jgi:hypothetical protein
VAPSSPFTGTPSTAEVSHFRAHERRRVRLPVTIRGERDDWERSGTVIDIHIAGAGIETDTPLRAGERVTVAFAAPGLWDPLILSAVIAWAHPLRTKSEVDPLGRPRSSARAGLTFDYQTPDATLAMFEMLSTLAYE